MKMHSPLRRAGATALGGLVAYLCMYCAFPMIYGKDRLQAAFRPRVYSVFQPQRWKTDRELNVVRYAEANTLVDHRMWKTWRTTNEVSNFMGSPNLIVQKGKREVWRYVVYYQRLAPAQSWLFPGRFPNDGMWAIEITFTEGKMTKCVFAGLSKALVAEGVGGQ